MTKSKVLVTGAIGFIGYHLTLKLVDEGHEVIGIDNINSYYDRSLKYAKLPILGIEVDNLIPNKLYRSKKNNRFRFAKTDITDRFEIEELFENEKFDIVVNLAAQAGVQYSITNPHTYIENNITGFINIIDAAKANNVKHFIYASSSSVYGDREDVPFKETDSVDQPISLYAASKRSNELIAHTYSKLYNLKTTGLRFFTVYGPWGRPDMAPYIFIKRIIEGKPITVFNNGNMERDFTYIDDIIDGVFKVVLDNKYAPKHKIYNVGNSKPINLSIFIQTIERVLDKKAIIKYMQIRKGDVKKTFSDITSIKTDFNYKPATDIEKGIEDFYKWYTTYVSGSL
jgi:UDP-glucuronate 4-epimerase